MSETPSMQPNSHPDASGSRAASAGSVPRPGGIDEESQGQPKMDGQDLAASDRPVANRPGSESSFSPASPSLPAQSIRSEASLKTVESSPMTSAAIVRELGHGLERIQQQGQHRVDLRLSLEGGGEVSIALQMRDGAVHASFQTTSAELREALQQGWSQMAARSENLPIPLAEPVFKGPSTTPGNAGQQDPRERREEPPAEQNQPATAFHATPHQPNRAVSPPAPARTATSGLNVWA